MVKAKSLSLLLMLVAFVAKADDAGWTLGKLHYDTKDPILGKVDIRAGYLDAAPEVPFRGNILYLEGLGDSMKNHDPLFQKLAHAGYRVIAFDYMGQGGSKGSMNFTRIVELDSIKIANLANQVWNTYKRPGNDERTVLGWSTGGLAAYQMAVNGWANKVVLIAPGICPRFSVGEGILHGNRISQETLTSDSYEDGKGPHVDPIRPGSPLLKPLFAGNLMLSSEILRHRSVPSSVSGFVALADNDKDRYVKNACAEKVLKKHASNFQITKYPGAKHEIDNEIEPIRNKLASDILNFLGGAPSELTAKTLGTH